MAGAICGGSPYVLRTEVEAPRWCFGERKSQSGIWELRSADPPVTEWPKGYEPSWWEPVWVYHCDGCGEDRRAGFGGWYEPA